MLLGSWALLVFGAFTFVAFIAALADAGRVPWRGLARFRPPGVVGVIGAIGGGVFAFFVAGYTGVLLAVTNRPIWSDTPLLGLNFLASAASTSAALLILLAPRTTQLTATDGQGPTSGVHCLKRFDSMALVLELLAIVALVLSLGSMARAWLDLWGVLLLVGVIVLGILVPLLLHWRPPGVRSGLRVAVSALLVLIGGFIFRVVVILSGDGIGRPM